MRKVAYALGLNSGWESRSDRVEIARLYRKGIS